MTMIAWIHRYLDGSQRDTWQYERAAALALELVLLAACAVATVTGWWSGLAAVAVGALRLWESEWRREEASVLGRHREQGGVSPLPPHKVPRAETRARQLEIVSWAWPGLTTLVAAAETGHVGLATAVAIGATLVRAAWGRVVMPRWRASRRRWTVVSILAHNMASYASGRRTSDENA